jgi:hypothetical protein
MISFLINTTASDGTDVFWPWFMWLLGAFILGIILGWLLKQIFGEKTSGEPPVDAVKDDLTKVEGIGPVIQELLNKDGIWSFKQLSNTSIRKLQKILDDAGPSFKVHNPRTWSAQARLADEGMWKELEVWQERLMGGL